MKNKIPISVLDEPAIEVFIFMINMSVYNICTPLNSLLLNQAIIGNYLQKMMLVTQRQRS